MIISLTPQRRDDVLTVIREGDALTLNGEVFDFASLPDGATYPADDIGCEWFAGPIERIAGVLHIALVLPHGPDPSHGVAFPAPIANPADGLVALPMDEVTNVDA